MDFTSDLKQAQINIYAKAAEILEQELGPDWKVEISKSARSGRFSIKRPLMIASFGTAGATKVGIGTSERGRQLKIIGIVGPNYSNTTDLANAIRLFVGDDSKMLEPTAPEPKNEEPEEIETPVDTRDPIIQRMDGPGINDPDNIIESREVKTARSLALATLKPKIALLENKLSEFGITVPFIESVNAKMNEWIVLPQLPTFDQWEAVKKAIAVIVAFIDAFLKDSEHKDDQTITRIKETILSVKM